jgi:phage gp36-like protein
MAYTDIEHVQLVAGGSERLQELSDFELSGDVDETVVNQAIADADGWMDTFIQKRFDVPVAEPSAAMAACSAQEAVYLMKTWRGMATDDDRVEHEKRELLLTAFANGANVLGISPLPTASELVVDETSSMPCERKVSRDKLKGYA